MGRKEIVHRIMNSGNILQELWNYPSGTPFTGFNDAEKALNLSTYKINKYHKQKLLDRGINMGLKLAIKLAREHPEVKDFSVLAEYVRRKYNAGK